MTDYIIDSPGKFIWTVKKYEKAIAVDRKNGRYFFNKLFDFGVQVIRNEVSFKIPKLKT